MRKPHKFVLPKCDCKLDNFGLPIKESPMRKEVILWLPIYDVFKHSHLIGMCIHIQEREHNIMWQEKQITGHAGSGLQNHPQTVHNIFL